MDDVNLTIARLTQLAEEDEAAKDAVRRAAIAAGEPKPRGFLENIAATSGSNTGRPFSQTTLGQQRWREALADQARRGATDYVFGRPGNPYTWFLINRLGQYSGPLPERAPAQSKAHQSSQLVLAELWRNNPWLIIAWAVLVGMVAVNAGGLTLL
jgi:hypothetical protein